MTKWWGTVACGAWLAAVPAGLVAQERWTLGAAAIGVASSPAFGGVAAVVTAPLTSELRIAWLASGGFERGELAGRGELAVQLVVPGRPKRWRWFLAGGLAGVVGDRSAGFILASVGAERDAGRRGLVWLEGGVAGGPRMVAGYRVRLGLK